MASTFLNISTDNTLGGDGASNSIVSSQKAIKEYVNETVSGKQDALVSGTNIKTVNGYSILGSGNISVGGGAGVWNYTEGTETLDISETSSAWSYASGTETLTIG